MHTRLKIQLHVWLKNILKVKNVHFIGSEWTSVWK